MAHPRSENRDRKVVQKPPDRPTLLYDRDCGFCRRWVRRRHPHIRKAVAFESYQAASGRYPEIPVDRLAKAVHLVRNDGTVASGALAIFEVLASRPAFRWLTSLYRSFWLFAGISECFYRIVASNRAIVSGLGRPFRRCRASARARRWRRPHDHQCHTETPHKDM